MSDEKKDDAGKLDTILKHLDSAATKMDAFGKRMDAMESTYSDGMKKLDAACAKMDADEEEKKKCDAAKADAAKADAAKADADKEEEKKKADAAKADADKEEEKKKDAAKADAARADSDIARRIEELSRRITDVPETERGLYIDAQMKADAVFQAFGDGHAPRYVNGEALPDYQRRLLTKYKGHSAHWKDVDLSKVDASVLGVAQAQIYADAMLAASAPSSVAAGTLRESIETDRTGRRISKFVGDPEACWGPFKQPRRGVTGMSVKQH